MSYWTDERVARLTQLFHEGRTGNQIAAALGDGATIGSIVGKLHRLGLKRNTASEAALDGPPAGPQPAIMAVASARMDRRHFRHTEARVGGRADALPAPRTSPVAAPAPSFRPEQRYASLGDALLALPSGSLCRWPMDLDDPADVRFCCEPAAHGASTAAGQHVYCAAHHNRTVGRGTDSERAAHRVSAAA